MVIRSGLLTILVILTLPLGVRAAGPESQEANFEKPVQTPDGVLQPGHYTISLEDQLPDRAIVRISEAGGAEHLLLTVPSTKVRAKGEGIVFFPNTSGTETLEAWKCGSCKAPLEFVYPKDAALKLTGETGKPVMAYDTSYDKLPANLTPEDRKVVTLWLLSPKTVTAAGHGEGVVAAKLNSANLTASNNARPQNMPKTAGTGYLEVVLGFLCLSLSGLIFLGRKHRLGVH